MEPEGLLGVELEKAIKRLRGLLLHMEGWLLGQMLQISYTIREFILVSDSLPLPFLSYCVLSNPHIDHYFI